MNRNDKWANNQDYRRAGDVEVSKDTKKAIEAAAVAHITLGDFDGFKLALSSLSKLQQKNDVEEIKAMMIEVLARGTDK